jgi:hypothetical protein
MEANALDTEADTRGGSVLVRYIADHCHVAAVARALGIGKTQSVSTITHDDFRIRGADHQECSRADACLWMTPPLDYLDSFSRAVELV